MTGPDLTYGIDDRPPLREALPLGAQHLVAMILGNITPPLLIAGALGVTPQEKALLLQMVLLMAGLSTLVQSYPIGPVGARLPIVMGTSVAFVGGLIGVGQQYGLATVFGACLVAAVVEIALGLSIGRVRRWFPPLVNGVVVMLIGLTLIPVGMDYAAGGVGASDYGALPNLAIAGLVALLTLALNQFGRGFLSYTSMLVAVVVGYLAALAWGRVDLSAVAESAWLATPTPLAFGLEFQWTPIFIVAFLYVVSTMETLGDIAGTVAVDGRDPTDQEFRGGLVADGVMSALAALWSAFPNTSYSQNVGLVNFTGVASRHVTAIAGGLLMLLGLVPKVGAFFATMPAPVIGGGGLIMFAMIFASGAKIVHRGEVWNQRTLVILAVSVAVGLGVELRPGALQALPQSLRSFFGSGLISGGLVALLANGIFPRRSEPAPNSRR